MSNKNYADVRTLVLTVVASALLSPGAWAQTFKVLHSFGGPADGLYSQYGLVFDGQGNLYGVTPYGPPTPECGNGDGCGTAYQLKPNPDGTWTETLINAFGGGWTESPLYQFPETPADPGELTFDAAGNIFGATRSGGTNGTGTIFILDRSSGWQESVLLNFDQYPAPSGAGPFGAITFDASGNLYGSTILGGTHASGVIYKLTKQGSTWQETVLYNFAGGSDGTTPRGVVFGPDGSLYGVTQSGGIGGTVYCFLGCGTVFKLTPNPDGTWTKTTVYAFRGGPHHAAIPVYRLTFDQAGNIYGTAEAGGPISSNYGCFYTGCGAVFKLTPSSGGRYTESILHFFSGGPDEGDAPSSPLAIDAAGNLYGTNTFGGTYGYGVAYEITP